MRPARGRSGPATVCATGTFRSAAKRRGAADSRSKTEFMANINGGAGNDNLTGLAGDDVIKGLGGNDNLTDTTGNDSMDGAGGNDNLTGSWIRASERRGRERIRRVFVSS